MISNDPFLKRRITHSHILWNNAFSSEELLNIQNLCEKEKYFCLFAHGEDVIKKIGYFFLKLINLI
jgi:hypothetical protein